METNPGPWCPVPAVGRKLCSNLRGLAGNLSDLTMASAQYDILLCSEIILRHASHVGSYWFPYLVALSCCAGARCLGAKAWLHMFEMVTEHSASPNLCGFCEMLVFRVCGVRQNL